MRFLSIISFFLIFTFCSYGQNQHLSFLIGRNRLDYLSGVQYSYKSGHNQLNAGMEVGISRTFGQSRFNPRLSAGYGYDLIARERLSFGPTVQYAYSWMKIAKAPSSNVLYNELLGGYFFEIGDQWKFAHQLFIGAMNERFKNQVNQEKELFWSTGYYASIGIKYRL